MVAAASGCPVRKTQTPRSLVKGVVPRTGRKVISSPASSHSNESPGPRRSSSLSDFGMTIRPALSRVSRVFIMARYNGSTQTSMPPEAKPAGPLVEPGGVALHRQDGGQEFADASG